jgi:hypothetical protein
MSYLDQTDNTGRIAFGTKVPPRRIIDDKRSTRSDTYITSTYPNISRSRLPRYNAGPSTTRRVTGTDRLYMNSLYGSGDLRGEPRNGNGKMLKVKKICSTC